MYDADGICWHSRFAECHIRHFNDEFFYYGRCRSGRRWFWAAYEAHLSRNQGDAKEAHGIADDEAAALDAARAAIVRLAGGRKAKAVCRADVARDELKKLNAAKRAARPPSNSKDSKPIEYLYGDSYGDDIIRFVRFQVTKITAKRIYYRNDGEIFEVVDKGESIDYGGIRKLYRTGVGFVDRQKLEADGTVCNRGRHWIDGDYQLYASLELLRERFAILARESKPDLAALKAAMAAAHPDRGGSNAAFIEARRAYVDAKRSARAK